jgi:hypothetical protein
MKGGWWVVLALLACDPASPGPSAGTNSNWLRACEVADGCGAWTSCMCGACTAVCDDDEDCAELPNAHCAPGVDTAARSVCGLEMANGAGICLPRCEPGDCEEGQLCVAGACVLAPLPDVSFCADVSMADGVDVIGAERLLAQVLRRRQAGELACNGQSLPAAPPLRLDARLVCAARVFAEDRARSGGRGLVDSQGRTTIERMRMASYDPLYWSEAFAVEAPSIDLALQWMLADEAICADVADLRLVDIGIAGHGDTYVITLGAEGDGSSAFR